MASLVYVQKAYGVPAKRGGRIRYTGEGHSEFGTITGANGGHLMVRLDGIGHSMPFHPTWKIEYLPSGGASTASTTERQPSPREDHVNLPQPPTEQDGEP